MNAYQDIPALHPGDAVVRDPLADGEPASVLVVDDNPAMLQSLAAVVSGMGLQVVTATSGREALRHLLQRDFALVLLDVNMPRMDGFETAQLIHGRPRSAHLPIIFVTAEAYSENDRTHGYNAGAVDFIHSPVLPEILRAKIQVFANLFYLNRRLQKQAEALRLRGAEIERQNMELEQANRMKSEFLANMSHELRTPLNAIIGFSDAMINGLAGDLTPQQCGYLGDILASGEHLLSLINDILDLSKIEAGKLELHLETFDLPNLLQSSLTVIKGRAGARGIIVSLDSPLTGNFRSDRRHLRQIIFNLLSNAEKFTPDNGRVTLAVRRVPAQVPLQAGCLFVPEIAAPEGDFLEIAVADTGIGMSAEDSARLFQPFVQLDSSLSRQYEGTGLGLALVKRLTQLHRGYIAVTSQVGSGSVFRVWLPWHDDDTEPERALGIALPAGSTPAPAAPIALVVEDDDIAAGQIVRLLEQEGLAVTRVSNGEDGLQLARHLRPQVITLDLHLPGMDGWQCLQRIKQDPLTANIPVVIISMADDAQKGIALGAVAVLQKPIERDDLAAILTTLDLPAADEGSLVLVVDDDPRAVEILALQLEASHYQVIRAGSGREAIALALSSPIDLIILDLMMPDLSGFDVLEALQHKEHTEHIPVIVVTAKHVTQEDLHRLNGYVLRIIEKSAFRGAAFINEVRRALLACRHA